MENPELKLIQEHRFLESNIDDLKLDLIYADDKDKADINKNIDQLKVKIKSIENDLSNVANSTQTYLKREHMLSVMRHLLRLLNLNKQLSRNQFMINDNYIYGVILSGITDAFNADYGSYPIPNLYYDDTDNFDAKPLTAFLEKKKNELENFIPKHYLELKHFADQFREEYLALFRSNKI